MLIARASCHFGTITPALLHILYVVEEYSRFHDLTVVAMSGSDGQHAPYSGHEHGEAVDVRIAGLSTQDEKDFLRTVLDRLGPNFYGELRHARHSNEHFHFQLRRGVLFEPPPLPVHAPRFTHRG
jgi:hypothetical protein